MASIFYIVVFILGLCIGSFLNVVILRLEKSEKLGGRSYCPHCKHSLMWLDLIPVFSFLFLRGECRYCGGNISWQYPIVELSTGLIFLLIFIVNLTPLQFSIFYFLFSIFLFYIASSLIVIFVYDLRHYIIPDVVLFPAIVVAFLYQILYSFQISNFKFQISAPLTNHIIAALIGSGFFLAIFLVSKGRWMGFGDVKLAVLLGLILGFPNILAGLFLAFFSGAIIGVILMLLDKKGMKSELPFAPFLILGTFLAMFWGQELISWYTSLFTLYV